MQFPDGLPAILFYCCGPVIRVAMPRTPVEFISSSGKTTAPYVCPTIPIGASGWRLADREEWRPLCELPPPWLPFLNRQRGSVMDPRPLPRIVAHDAILDGGDQ